MPFDNLGFETEDATLLGSADGWTIAYVTAGSRVCGFGFGQDAARPDAPHEGFGGGWSSNESYVFVFVGVGTDLDVAIFDQSLASDPEGVEDFDEGWLNWPVYLFAFPTDSPPAAFGNATFVESTNPSPFALSNGDTLELTTELGTASSNAVSAIGAAIAGTAVFPAATIAGAAYPFRLEADDFDPIIVDLAGATTVASAVAIINAATQAAWGVDVAVDSGTTLDFESPTAGSASFVRVTEIEPAKSITTNAAPFALSNGWTVTIEVDGGAGQLVTFNSGDFGDISNANAFEVAEVITAQLTGARALALYGAVRIVSETLSGSSIEVTGGTAVAALGLNTTLYESPLGEIGHVDTSDAGVGNVLDVANVTAAELAVIVNNTPAITAIGAELRVASEAAADGLRAYSQDPDVGTVQVSAGAITTAVGFPTGAFGPLAGATTDHDPFDVDPFFFELADIAGIAAQFDTSPAEGVEDFEDEWSNDTYHVLTGDLGGTSSATPAVFDDAAETVEDFEEVSFPFTFTANPTLDQYTAVGHPLGNGEIVTLENTGGQLPDGLNKLTNYYVVGVSGSIFQLARTSGGTAINIDDAGTGTHTLRRSPIDFWTTELVL